MIDIALLHKTEIAKRIGVSQVYVYYLLAGMRRNERRLEQIAVLLHTTVDALKAEIRRHKNGQADARGVRNQRHKTSPGRALPARKVRK